MSMYNGVQMVNGKPFIWLQCYGLHPAIKAQDIKPGMLRVYNTGTTAPIVAVDVGKMVTITTVEGGKRYESKRRPDTYIPVKY
jgi:hypothetical protein